MLMLFYSVLDDVLEAYNLIKDLEPTVPPVRQLQLEHCNTVILLFGCPPLPSESFQTIPPLSQFNISIRPVPVYAWFIKGTITQPY